jgi:hypothetical protein
MRELENTDPHDRSSELTGILPVIRLPRLRFCLSPAYPISAALWEAIPHHIVFSAVHILTVAFCIPTNPRLGTEMSFPTEPPHCTKWNDPPAFLGLSSVEIWG